MANRKMFPDSIIPCPTSGVTAHGMTVNAADPQHRAEKMDVSFSLGFRPLSRRNSRSGWTRAK